MKLRFSLMMAVLILLIFQFSYPLAAEIKEVKIPIPEGWKFRKFDVSISSHIAVYYVPDLAERELAGCDVATLLQIFNLRGDLLFERWLDPREWFFSFTPQNMILLARHGRYCLLDLEGNGKLNFADSHFGERKPVYDLYNREIALSPGTGIESYPCEVINMNTGKTKFKLGPIKLPENQSVLPPGFIFLPVGRDDLYVLGLGGTLCLRRYGDQKDIWKIDYIGGHIRK